MKVYVYQLIGSDALDIRLQCIEDQNGFFANTVLCAVFIHELIYKYEEIQNNLCRPSVGNGKQK